MLGIRPLDLCFSASWRPTRGFVVFFTCSLGYCLASFTLYTRLIDLDTASFPHRTTIFFHSLHRLLSAYFLLSLLVHSYISIIFSKK
jgi:hypothetical protein